MRRVWKEPGRSTQGQGKLSWEETLSLPAGLPRGILLHKAGRSEDLWGDTGSRRGRSSRLSSEWF